MCVGTWLSQSIGKDEVALREFSGIVREIYILVGPDPQPEHPLLKILLELVDCDNVSLVHNTGRNQPLLLGASKDVAEFGRDLLLRLMAKTGSTGVKNNVETPTTRELCIGYKVRCPGCEVSWYKVAYDVHNEGHCVFCGEYFEDWTRFGVLGND